MKKGKTRFLWLTDLHLDDVTQEKYEQFLQQIRSLSIDGIFICGDIAEEGKCFEKIKEMYSQVNCPIYFILGNHDFYGTTIKALRQIASKTLSKKIVDLTFNQPIYLTPSCALIGHDGWANGSKALYLNSSLRLRDEDEVGEFQGKNQEETWKQLNELGMASALSIESRLREVFKTCSKAIVLTHVPPYRRACLYQGKVADDVWAPHFVNEYLGKRLDLVMQEYSNCQLLLLCGHAHHICEYQRFENLKVLTGGIEVGKLTFQGIIDIDCWDHPLRVQPGCD